MNPPFLIHVVHTAVRSTVLFYWTGEQHCNQRGVQSIKKGVTELASTDHRWRCLKIFFKFQVYISFMIINLARNCGLEDNEKMHVFLLDGGEENESTAQWVSDRVCLSPIQWHQEGTKDGFRTSVPVRSGETLRFSPNLQHFQFLVPYEMKLSGPKC